MKVWDKLCWGNRKVGLLAHGGHRRGDSGAKRLITTVWKSAQKRGSEQSGIMVLFRTFMENEHPEKIKNGMHHAPFLENKFSILIYNAVRVFYLYESLEVFFERVSGEDKLLTAV